MAVTHSKSTCYLLHTRWQSYCSPQCVTEMLVATSYIKDEINKARQSSSGLIIRQKEPNNLETPFDEVDSFLTPTELFYIRSHFPAPKLEVGSYQLHIDGAVRNPFYLSHQELRDMPSETRVALLECAGNSH